MYETRPSLGNVAVLGELYDARSNAFSGSSILKTPLPQSTVQITKNPTCDVVAIQDDFIKKCELSDVDFELQVSILAEIIQIGGSALHLLNKKRSASMAKCLLLYHMKTQQEYLNIYEPHVISAVKSMPADIETATHMVVGVFWGATSVVACESQNIDDDTTKELEMRILIELKKISVGLQKNREPRYNATFLDSFEFEVYGDVLSRNEGLSIEDALNLIKRTPDLLKSFNGGKGTPLAYKLLPIQILQKKLALNLQQTVTTRSVPKSILTRLIQLFLSLFDSQKKIYGFLNAAQSYSFCIKPEDLAESKSIEEKLVLHEKQLKSQIATKLIQFRSGLGDGSELISIADNFEESNFSTQNVDSFLERKKHIHDKIAIVKKLGGVKYIGVGANFHAEISKQPQMKCLVLVFSQKSLGDTSLWETNLNLFLTEKREQKEYIPLVLDCDIFPEFTPRSNSSCVQIVQGVQLLCADLRLEQQEEAKIPLVQAVTGTKPTSSKPYRRAPLRVPCPDANCQSNKTYDWTCLKCMSPTEWGFDEHIYCECGMTPLKFIEFKCPDGKHNAPFQKYADTQQTKQMFSNLSPFKELNILIMGETGVGKSTWINAFVNFMKHRTLSDAERKDIITLIPTEFTVFASKTRKVLVRVGKPQDDEVLETGQSATQTAKIYSFTFEDTLVRLIDTPGVGDVRGIDHDKKNFENILGTISLLDNLHGICILLRPHNSRLNVMFRFCIKELLKHLHRDASKNIVFCFTNSRGTLYRPGDTMPPLQKLLAEVGVPIKDNNIFCYDSEAYRFLAAIKNDPPVEYSEMERNDFAKSWEHSQTETNRMLEYIRELVPHPIKSTVSLNYARTMILQLTRPLAEIQRNIFSNKLLVAEESEKIQKGNLTIEQLKAKVYTTRTEIDVTKLPYPKTVCSNSRCVEKKEDTSKRITVMYTQVCHDHCYLTGIPADSIGDPRLINCTSQYNGVCRLTKCGHSYREHLHVYYDSTQVARQVIDTSVQEALKTTTNAQEATKQIIASKKKVTKEYEAALKEIKSSSAKFAYFLKTNAITPYNDGMEMYLDHLIREESEKVGVGGCRKVLDALVQNKATYMEELRILQKALGNGNMNKIDGLDPGEIESIINRLKELKHCGADLRTALQCVTMTSNSVSASALIHIPVMQRRKMPTKVAPLRPCVPRRTVPSGRRMFTARCVERTVTSDSEGYGIQLKK